MRGRGHGGLPGKGGPRKVGVPPAAGRLGELRAAPRPAGPFALPGPGKKSRSGARGARLAQPGAGTAPRQAIAATKPAVDAAGGWKEGGRGGGGGRGNPLLVLRLGCQPLKRA